METTNSNGFLTRKVTGRNKRCSEQIPLKKSMTDSSPAIILGIWNKDKIKYFAIKPARQILKSPLSYFFIGDFFQFSQ